jgi:hypothetical protein
MCLVSSLLPLSFLLRLFLLPLSSILFHKLTLHHLPLVFLVHPLFLSMILWLNSKPFNPPKDPGVPNIHTNKHSSIDRFVCQLCLKKAHTTDRCYKWFDATYKSPPPRSLPKNHSYQSHALCVQPGHAPPET